MISLGDLILFFRGDSKDLDKAFSETEQSAGSWSGKVGGIIGDGLKTLVAGAAIGVTSAIAGIGVAAFKMADDTQAATNMFKTQLGSTADEAARLKDVTLSIFGANFGNDMSDAAAAVAQVEQNLSDFGVTSDEELQSASQSAIMLRDAFGFEFGESVGAVQSLMENFGLTSQQAFDFLVTGQQNGLNLSGDLLDSINEYAPQFANANATADQFYSVLANGSAAGTLGTDKAADAFKEAMLRIADGSESSREALGKLGISADQLWADMASGKTTGADAFQAVIVALNQIEDPLERNAAGVALLGSQYEDLGATGALSLDLNTHKLADMAGATESLNAQYDTFGSLFTGAWRSFSVNVLGPIGENLMNIARSIMPSVLAGIEKFGAALSSGQGIGGIASAFGAMIASAWPAAQAALAGLLQQALAWVQASAGPLLQSLAAWAQALAQWVIDAAPGLISALGGMLTQMLDWISASVPTWLQSLMQLGQAMIQMAIDAAPGLLQALADLLLQMQNWVISSIPQWAENLKALGIQLWQWIVDVLPELGTKLGEVLAVIINWAATTITTIAPKLTELAGAFLAWIWRDVVPALPGALGQIWTALSGFLANLLVQLAPVITELASKFYNWITDEVLPAIPGKLAEVWSAIETWISDTASKAWESAKQIGQSIADGIGGAISSGLDALHGMVASVINPIIDGINTAIDGMNVLGAGIGHIPRMAKGGITAGGLVVLGEQGPERVNGHGINVLAGPGLYSMPSGLTVTPHKQTMAGIAASISNAGGLGGLSGPAGALAMMQQAMAAGGSMQASLSSVRNQATSSAPASSSIAGRFATQPADKLIAQITVNIGPGAGGNPAIIEQARLAAAAGATEVINAALNRSGIQNNYNAGFKK